MSKKEIDKKLTTDPESIINTSYNNNRTVKVINKSFPHDKINSVIAETGSKNYELFNVVSETGDSIYSLSFEELTIAEENEGQVFISVDKILDIVQHELAKYYNSE